MTCSRSARVKQCRHKSGQNTPNPNCVVGIFSHDQLVVFIDESGIAAIGSGDADLVAIVVVSEIGGVPVSVGVGGQFPFHVVFPVAGVAQRIDLLNDLVTLGDVGGGVAIGIYEGGAVGR